MAPDREENVHPFRFCKMSDEVYYALKVLVLDPFKYEPVGGEQPKITVLFHRMERSNPGAELLWW